MSKKKRFGLDPKFIFKKMPDNLKNRKKIILVRETRKSFLELLKEKLSNIKF